LTKKDERPEPQEHERAGILAAIERTAVRQEPVEVALAPSGQPDVLKIVSPHTDDDGFLIRVVDAMGTASDAFAMRALGRISSVIKQPGHDLTAEQVNAAIALMAGIAPANELEAALGEQIVGTHTFAMEMLRQARWADTIPRLEAYSNVATKAQRTLAMMVDALAKLRTGGKQQVEVRYVYVDARGSQNVISAGGPGGPIGNIGQSHATALPDAIGPAVWGPDALGMPLQVTGGEGPEALQDARGDQPRGAVGEGQRPLSDGPAHLRATRGPRVGSRTRAVRKGRG
jgi:hypothetical protein